MLRVRLREHHEFRIRRVALQVAVAVDEVVDFLAGQRESKIRIRGNERVASLLRQRHDTDRRRFVCLEQRCDTVCAVEDRFGHAIEQQVAQCQHVVVVDLAVNFRP